MYKSADTPAKLPQQEACRDDDVGVHGYFGGQQKMGKGYFPDIPAQEHTDMDSHTEVEHGSSPQDLRNHDLTLSSEDEMPLIRRSRQVPQQSPLTRVRKPDMSSPASFKEPSKQAPPTGFWEPNTSSAANVKQSSQKALFTSSQGPYTSSPKGIEQTDIEQPRIRKKPGPKPWAQRAISKNDTEAKMQVIRAIEKNWGKNFIYYYIPKCHRPLQKRNAGKRPTFRQHEADPKYWLPSVLKCVLNVSKLSSDKNLLRQIFTDIVRHRIKNTGNRKPQLVTTDFDVAEDMLSHGWDLGTSFAIRYKHLLLSQPRGKIETDEDIDHILAVGDDDYEPVIDDSEDEEMIEVTNDVTEDREEGNSTSGPGPNYFHGHPHRVSKVLISKEKKPTKSTKQTKNLTSSNQSKRPEPPSRSEAQFSSEAMSYQNPFGAYGMPPPGYAPYGPYQGYPPMQSYPRQEHMKGYPPPPPMYPWTGYGHFPGYEPTAPNKGNNVQNSSPQPGAYPPHGFPGMPHYPYPMPPAPSATGSAPPFTPGSTPFSAQPSVPTSAPPSTPGLLATSHTPGNLRFSPFGHSKRSSPLITEGNRGRYDAAGHLVGTRIKLESGINDDDDDDEVTIENYNHGAFDDADGEDEEMADDEMLREIAEQEKRVEMLKAKLAKKKNKE